MLPGLRTLPLVVLAVWGMASPAQPEEERRWKRLGGTGVAAAFAGPAGSPVDSAWFSADGLRLYASLQHGGLWASDDLGLTWKPAEQEPLEPRAVTDPAPSAGHLTVLRNPYRAGVAYALGEHLYRSDDGGREWTNLTATRGESVIGRWQSVLAISPLDPDVIVVGNSMGLWKSHDEGVTWSSLNPKLPNFPAARFIQNGASSHPALQTGALGRVDLMRTASGAIWRSDPSSRNGPLFREEQPIEPELPLPARYALTDRVWRDGKPISGALTHCAGDEGCSGHTISAFSAGGELWAGTSNGRIWVSANDGGNWRLSWSDPDGNPVASLWTDPELPSTALAIAGGRVLRSTNSGASWFDISSDLPASPWTVVVGHPSAGAVYVAGTQGVYFALADLDAPGPTGPWIKLSGDLPAPAATDLALDPLRGRLYVSLAGYGVYWTRTPHVERALRVLSAADLTVRPVAPGSLLTITGASAVRARAGGRPAPILNSDLGRTQLQVPFAVRGNSMRLRLEVPGNSHTLDLPLQRVSPAIFVVAGEPLVLDAGTGALIGWDRPAKAGGTVLVMATGLGEVDPPWPAGLPSPESDPPRTVAQVNATLAGLPAKVLAAHLAPGFVGIYLVEVQIPFGTHPGAVELAIEAEDRLSNAVPLVIGR